MRASSMVLLRSAPRATKRQERNERIVESRVADRLSGRDGRVVTETCGPTSDFLQRSLSAPETTRCSTMIAPNATRPANNAPLPRLVMFAPRNARIAPAPR